MKNKDDMTALALEYLALGETPEYVIKAFAGLPPAPLATCIADFLAAQPRIDIAPLLHKIASLNEGRLEDLNSPEFLSHLIAETETDEEVMKRVVRVLGTFDSLVRSSLRNDERLLIAARDDEDSAAPSSTTMSELLKQLKKRAK